MDGRAEGKTNSAERAVIGSGGAMALGRTVDSQITTALTATTQATVTLTVSTKAAILATALQFQEAVWANDVPNDGEVFHLPTCDGREAAESEASRESYGGVKAHVRHVHMHDLDDAKGFNYKEFFGLLQRDNYQGFMSAEIQPSDDPERVLGLYVALWRELVENALDPS